MEMNGGGGDGGVDADTLAPSLPYCPGESGAIGVSCDGNSQVSSLTGENDCGGSCNNQVGDDDEAGQYLLEESEFNDDALDIATDPLDDWSQWDAGTTTNEWSIDEYKANMQAIISQGRALSKVKRVLEKRCRQLNDKVSILTASAPSRNGKGKNLYRLNIKDSVLEARHKQMICDFVNDTLFRNTPILPNGWEVWKDGQAKTLSNIVTKKVLNLKNGDLDSRGPHGGKVALYWSNVLVPMINYRMTTKRGNLTKRVSQAYNGEHYLTLCESTLPNHEYSMQFCCLCITMHCCCVRTIQDVPR